jgi:hypothetical protein
MWKKWALSAIAYLLIVMVGYGIYVSIAGSDSNPSHQEQMNIKGH